MRHAPDLQLDASAATSGLAGRRVRFVLPSLELGGAERQALLLAQGLKSQCGAQVDVWGLNSPGLASQMCEAAGMPWRVWPCAWSNHPGPCRRTLLRFAAALQESPPDVLMPYCGLPNLLCGTVWRWTGARACIWNQRDEGRDRKPRWIEALAVANVSRFVSNSAEGAAFLTSALEIPAERVDLIHNGVQLAAPKADRRTWRRRLGLTEDALAACMVANLHSFKDHATLVRAWRLVAEQLQPEPPPLLLLAGYPGDTQNAVIALIAELGLTQSVQLVGQVEDVPGLLAAVDILVHSAIAEGLPNAVLEAMATGLPVVGTNLVGLREALGPAGDSWLVPARDPHALADRVLLLVRDRELRARLGAAHRQRIVQEFSTDRLVRATAQVIGQSLQEGPATSAATRAWWQTRWVLGSRTRVAANFGVLASHRLHRGLRQALWHVPGAWRLMAGSAAAAPGSEESKQ